MTDGSIPESNISPEIIAGIAEVERQAKANWASDPEAMDILNGQGGTKHTPTTVPDHLDPKVKWSYRVVRVIESGDLVLGFQKQSLLRPDVFIDYKATISKGREGIRFEEFTGVPDLQGEYGQEPVWTLENTNATLDKVFEQLGNQQKNLSSASYGQGTI